MQRACTAVHSTRLGCAISFIRTVTVGPGIAPDLLTPAVTGTAGRSRAAALQTRIPPVGNSAPP